MLSILRRLRRDEAGTSAVEYGLILAMIVLAMLSALAGVAEESDTMWTNIADKSKEAVDQAR